MKKILLLGASGQLGQQWQYYLDDEYVDSFQVIPYTSAQLDITRPENVRHEFKKQEPDFVFNCAAFTKVDQAEEEREKAQAINATAVRTIAELCARYDTKLIHFSTDYIFAGNKKDQELLPNGYPEDHPVDPINWYGRTKWEGEEAIRKSGCDYLILRVSWLCGAYGSNFVNTMLRLANEHEELKVVNDQVGSPTFCDNLVQNTMKLIEAKKNGTYHCASEGKISWADFANAIFEITDRETQVRGIPSSEYPTKANRPYYSKLDTNKIKQVRNVELEDWKKGLKRLVRQIEKK